MDSQEWRSAIKAAATEDIDTGVRQLKLLYIIAQLILNIHDQNETINRLLEKLVSR